MMNGTNGEELLTGQTLHFKWPEYTTFVGMLLVSAVIGIYFGFFGSRQKTVAEYLLGGRQMSVLPVATSLVASHISGVTVLGVPSEIYTYGTQYWVICGASIIVGLVIVFVFLPVFYKLQLTSTFEYLELRFSRSIRVTASLFYTLAQVLYVPIVVYLPALAFSQVTGVNLHLITPVVSIICIFYTTVGGIKAVVWTDFIQQITMMGACILVIILGAIRIGGLSNMWRINMEGDRIEFFNMDPSIFARMTFFSTLIGMTFIHTSTTAISPAMIQRFLSVPTLKAAKTTVILYTIGMIMCKTISCVQGLLMYAQFQHCDPLRSKAIKHQDQLLPYYVMDIIGQIPGLPGLFVAGVFSAALSTMSTCLNTISGTIFEDFIAPYLPQKMREERGSIFMKIIVVVMGTICVVMVLLVEKLGAAVQMTISLGSVTYGALLGLYSLGMLCPWANTKGALVGGLSSLVFVGIMVTGSQAAIAAKQLVHPKKPTSIEGCLHLNSTEIHDTVPLLETISEPPFVLFRVSFLYFSAIGTTVVLIVGSLVSWCTRSCKEEEVNRDLFSPVIHRWLPKIPDDSELTVGEPLIIQNKIKQ